MKGNRIMDSSEVYKNMLNDITPKNIIDIVRPVAGENIFRFIKSKDVPFLEVKKHFPPTGGSFVCGQTIGQPCPWCEEMKNSFDENFRQSISPKTFFWVSVWDKDTVKVAEIKKKVVIAVLNILADPDTCDCLELKEGRAFKVTKSGQGLATDYMATPQMKKTEVPENIELLSLKEEVKKLWEIGEKKRKKDISFSSKISEVEAQEINEKQKELLKDIEGIF